MKDWRLCFPVPTDDLATCSADIQASILPPQKHSSYPALPSLDSPMLVEWLLGLSLKCTSAHLPLLVSTPPNSSLAHKALQGKSPLTCSSFLATPPVPCVLPNPVFCLSLKRLVFSCLCASAHIPCPAVWGMFFPCQIFFFLFSRPNSSTKYFIPLVRNYCSPLWDLISIAVCTDT